MKHAGLSIRGLMVLVGILALNLGAAKALSAFDLLFLAYNFPVLLVLQFAVYRLIRARGRSRVFWAGFLAAGFLGTASFDLGLFYHLRMTFEVDPDTGQMHETTPHGPAIVEATWRLWDAYIDGILWGFKRLPVIGDYLFASSLGRMILATLVVIWAAQILVALAGAWLARLLLLTLGRREATRPAPGISPASP